MNRKRVLCVFCFLLAVTVMGIVMNPVSAPSDLTLASARAPAISAGSAMLIDASDGTVLYEYNADKKMSPASTTKIMTAMVTLDICRELGVGLDSEILVPKEAEGVEFLPTMQIFSLVSRIVPWGNTKISLPSLENRKYPPISTGSVP